MTAPDDRKGIEQDDIAATARARPALGGYEYNLVLIAALLALVDGGPGELSVDRALGINDTGLPWALAALGLGAAAPAH